MSTINNRDKIIQQLKDQIKELHPKYYKAIKERDSQTIEETDEEIYKLDVIL